MYERREKGSAGGTCVCDCESASGGGFGGGFAAELSGRGFVGGCVAWWWCGVRLWRALV